MHSQDVGPDNNYYSQEFNLISADGPFNWIVGANWFYRETLPSGTIETYTCGINPATGIFTACPPEFTNQLPALTIAGSVANASAGAVFGQVNWKFVENLEVTVGARYNVDKNSTLGRDTPGGVVPVVLNGGPSPGNCPADIRGIPRYSQVNWATTSCLAAGAAVQLR